MEKEDISYKLQIMEGKKIVAEQLVTHADYLPRIGEILSLHPYEGPLDGFIEKIREKEEWDKYNRWIKWSSALLRFQQEFAGDYQVTKVQYALNLFAAGTNFCRRLSNLGKDPWQSPHSDFDPKEEVEISCDLAIKLYQKYSIPLVVVTKLDSKEE